MDIVGITFVDDCDFAEAIFAIAGFVLKQVIFASTAAHYLTTSSHAEAFGGRFTSFELCHDT